jgi:hypothetical protein
LPDFTIGRRRGGTSQLNFISQQLNGQLKNQRQLPGNVAVSSKLALFLAFPQFESYIPHVNHNEFITTGLIRQVQRQLRSDSDHLSKRAEPRVGLRCPLLVHRWISGAIQQPMGIWVRDLSAKGIGILSHFRLERGEQFIAKVPGGDNDGSRSKSLVCVVNNCTPVAAGLYRVGATMSA